MTNSYFAQPVEVEPFNTSDICLVWKIISKVKFKTLKIMKPYRKNNQ